MSVISGTEIQIARSFVKVQKNSWIGIRRLQGRQLYFTDHLLRKLYWTWLHKRSVSTTTSPFAFAIISEETRKNPALIECVARVVYDLVTEPRFIDIYVSPDVSLCPPNMREVNLLMESFTQCSVRLRWLIDFEKIEENNSHL